MLVVRHSRSRECTRDHTCSRPMLTNPGVESRFARAQSRSSIGSEYPGWLTWTGSTSLLNGNCQSSSQMCTKTSIFHHTLDRSASLESFQSTLRSLSAKAARFTYVHQSTHYPWLVIDVIDERFYCNPVSSFIELFSTALSLAVCGLIGLAHSCASFFNSLFHPYNRFARSNCQHCSATSSQVEPFSHSCLILQSLSSARKIVQLHRGHFVGRTRLFRWKIHKHQGIEHGLTKTVT